ncbi:chemotaxis protein [Paramagnetospirillum kuznetsovii]|uniref:Chemotaxis protein n=1 Tax=Paramagnetospirillum kuznetsovii TaxID=2053833 RepID=A0A364P2X6_9PROT|nr:PAS domain-containing protein [Paramagnetospirillum kuznetsovii]RAU23646.1 chemotaxis protein [Paramagnetospirillum kuznetsovii]
MAIDRSLTNVARTFQWDDVIVSKTDLTGKITYANEVFIDISGYTEKELLGAPHSILRHPAMPRCVFKFLWDRIADGHEVFAYVINRARNGDHYWVFAHVTPCTDHTGKIVGYHSNRRVPKDEAIATIAPLYQTLLGIEEKAGDRKLGVEQSFAALVKTIGDLGFDSYDRLIMTLSR